MHVLCDVYYVCMRTRGAYRCAPLSPLQPYSFASILVLKYYNSLCAPVRERAFARRDYRVCVNAFDKSVCVNLSRKVCIVLEFASGKLKDMYVCMYMLMSM